MAKKRGSLLDDILATAKNGRPGKVAWYDKLSAEARRDLEDSRKKFRAGALGDLQVRAVARAMVAVGKKRGWPMPSHIRVEEWLRSDR